MPSSTVAWAGRLAAGKIGAVFSALLDIGAVPQPRTALPPPHPFCVTMTGVAVLAFLFFSATLAGPKLLQLLQHSRESFDNLQRLQGRVIQQAKLASLGELVALAASELDHPLSAILSNSERMAASSSLSREQLATAQKIGSRPPNPELVNDLLSFASRLRRKDPDRTKASVAARASNGRLQTGEQED